MARVFISYRRADAAADAGRVADCLSREAGVEEVFFDVDHIKFGEDFVTAIEEAIARFDTVLVMIGPQWLTLKGPDGKRRLDNEKDYVRLEIASALKRKLRVVPVLVQGASMPAVEDLPPELAELPRRQAFEIRATRFHRDVEDLIAGLTRKRSGAGLLFRRPAAWFSMGGALIALALFYWFGAIPQSFDSKTSPGPRDFKLKVQIRLNEQFGPVDVAVPFVLVHRLPKERQDKSLLDVGTPIADRFEYGSDIVMPNIGEKYHGLLSRLIVGARRGTSQPMDVCFERKQPSVAGEAIVRLRCEEGEKTCSIASDDFGWARLSTCGDLKSDVSWFITSAYAQSKTRATEEGWVAPSLETLREQRKGKKSLAYTEFFLTSGPLPVLKKADRLYYEIRANGSPIYIDGLPWQANSIQFDANKGINMAFGLENLDFAGRYQGRDHVEVILRFTEGDRIVKQASVLLNYIALRDEPVGKTVRDGDIEVFWKARYYPGKVEDVYQIFVFSDRNLEAVEELKRKIDQLKVPSNGETITAVIRPPLSKNPNYGIALGRRQSSGQIKFTFDDPTSREICKVASRNQAMLSLKLGDATRRNVDNRDDSKNCKLLSTDPR